MNATKSNSAEAEVLAPDDEPVADASESRAVAAHKESAAVAEQAGGAVTPMQLLQIAMDKGADLDRLEKLMDMQDRWEKNEARKEYVAAMAGFKADPPQIIKNMHISYTTDKGTTAYDSASLDQVSGVIGKALAEHGISHRWHTDQPGNGQITVTCILTHDKGHSESTSLSASPDQSGGKNNIQAVGSTITYLQRYTLLAATGMAAKGQDDDGRTSEGAKTLDENQIEHVEALLQGLIERAPTNEAKFYDYISKVAKAEITSPKEIPQRLYAKAIQTLNEAGGHV